MRAAQQRILVSGRAGFIGSALCRHLVSTDAAPVPNFDKLTHAAFLISLAGVEDSELHSFERGDITDAPARFKPTAVMHLAAESRVGHSIGDA
ncbi:NAD-dependent epimerase/dehydratase family protein [Caulobacter sp. UNC279MFTsu5.1]|uniref:NAD-dependent epimerase/dehydratase family protein n=1 Tax=Caulobacter sp. UNC279MFTsu5.1 TaxID=1502775 RepID=UPI00037A1494|nr:NAD-dependent epimerase/dehydratase family protein [Caulobacter sp. UNC279MFTsu5.1]SFJ46778.1 NAD dependent epimerase/dehydratase family protein [Caulobacter sp. UNC279MFTsu5.1]